MQDEMTGSPVARGFVIKNRWNIERKKRRECWRKLEENLEKTRVTMEGLNNLMG